MLNLLTIFQNVSVSSVRFGNVYISKGVPRIFTTNLQYSSENQREETWLPKWLTKQEIEAINSRVGSLHIKFPLFKNAHLCDRRKPILFQGKIQHFNPSKPRVNFIFPDDLTTPQEDTNQSESVNQCSVQANQ